MQAVDSSYFCGKGHFEDSGTQNYLLSQPMYSFFQKIGNIDIISAWKSKSSSDEMRVEPWFFVAFSIILKHLFPENFIKFPQVVQKI